MKLLARQRAQSISEYVVLVSLVSFVLTGMSLYIKRGVQAVIKNTADIVGDQTKGGITFDYKNPLYNFKTASQIEETQVSDGTTTSFNAGEKQYVKNKISGRKGLLSEANSYEGN